MSWSHVILSSLMLVGAACGPSVLVPCGHESEWCCSGQGIRACIGRLVCDHRGPPGDPYTSLQGRCRQCVHNWDCANEQLCDAAGSCQDCGQAPGQLCCAPPNQCHLGMFCNLANGICTSCGRIGQVCCPFESCREGGCDADRNVCH